jgi:Na+-driven multidrug efflux pump
LGLICAVVLTLVGLSFAEYLFTKLGATAETLDLATGYIHPIFWGATFFLLSSMSNSILLAHGDSKTFGKVLVAGFFLNLLLDPWFLYGGFGIPEMGVPGIAYSTVIIQALGGLFLLSTVLRRGYVKLHSIANLLPDLKIYGEILRQGIPTSFSMMSIPWAFLLPLITSCFMEKHHWQRLASEHASNRLPCFLRSGSVHPSYR